MNVKLLISCFLLTNSLYSYGQGEPRLSGVAARCAQEVAVNKVKRSQQEKIAVSECDRLAIAASLNGYSLDEAPLQKQTLDGKGGCFLQAGYTLDFNDCKRVLLAYNAVVIAEKAMIAQQAIRITENNQKANQEMAKQTAAGKGQEAALDAVEERSRQNAQMNTEKFYTYLTAVSALGGTLAAWQGKGSKAISKFCAKNLDVNKVKNDLGITLTQEECPQYLESDVKKLFANDDSRVNFTLLAAEYVKKAAEAKRLAGLNKDIAAKLGNRPQDDEGEVAKFEKCALTPFDPECTKSTDRSATSTFKGGSFSMGSGEGHAFNMNDTGENSEFGEAGASTNLKDTTHVASVNSPFMDEAKAANKILDEAGAASVQPTGGAGGGGGGGGAGGGFGGGSASLGNDLQADSSDSNKSSDIKSKQFSASYSKGGAKFGAVKGGKDDNANPFSSLFDSKTDSGGGVEEDRSIASDIKGEGSGLFQKISKRYVQVHQDKRIEARNLE
jgi:hypothetical protein